MFIKFNFICFLVRDGNQLNAEDLKHICDKLEDMKKLNSLSLSIEINQILTTGAYYLENCLKTLKNLNNLSLQIL